jgi:hypothetical protein
MKDAMVAMTFAFKNCVVRLEESGFTETVFPDGTRVPAYPTGCPDQLDMAEKLGYGPDLARMCREHEILHTWLCELFGLPYSPTLWAVAHGQAEGCAPVRAQQEEESLVLAFQALLNDAAADSHVLKSLTDRGMSPDVLKREARQLLRAA